MVNNNGARAIINSHSIVKKRGISFVEVIDYIWILSIILSTNTVFWNILGKRDNYLISLLLIGSSAMLSFYVAINFHAFKISIGKQMIMATAYFLLILPIIINSFSVNELSQSELLRVVVFPVLVIPYLDWLIEERKIGRLANIYIWLITIFSALSLILWGGSEVGVFKPNMSVVMNWGGHRTISGIWNIQFFPQGEVNFLGVNVIRNCGFFSEAPMFSFVITLALLIIIFWGRQLHVKLWQTLILGICLLSTTATTGLLIVIIAMAVRAFSTAKGLVKFAIGIIGFPVVIYVAGRILDAKVNSMGASVNIRLEDFVAGYHAWMQHPVVGNGLSNSLAYMPYISFSRLALNGNNGFSSGIMQILSKVGLYGGVLYAVLPVVLVYFVSSSAFWFAIILLLDLTMTVVDGTYCVLILVLLAYIGFINALTNKSRWI